MVTYTTQHRKRRKIALNRLIWAYRRGRLLKLKKVLTQKRAWGAGFKPWRGAFKKPPPLYLLL